MPFGIGAVRGKGRPPQAGHIQPVQAGSPGRHVHVRPAGGGVVAAGVEIAPADLAVPPAQVAGQAGDEAGAGRVVCLQQQMLAIELGRAAVWLKRALAVALRQGTGMLEARAQASLEALGVVWPGTA